jgi:hypothetical protein
MFHSHTSRVNLFILAFKFFGKIEYSNLSNIIRFVKSGDEIGWTSGRHRSNTKCIYFGVKLKGKRILETKRLRRKESININISHKLTVVFWTGHH